MLPKVEALWHAHCAEQPCLHYTFANIPLVLTISSNVLPTVDASWFQEQ